MALLVLIVVCNAVFGSCCCYCGSGSAVTVHTATSPLGPFSTQNVISFTQACRKGSIGKQASLLAALGVDAEPISLLDAAPGVRGRQLQATIPAQQTHIGAFKTAAGTEYMWIGDRWQVSASWLVVPVVPLRCVAALIRSHPLGILPAVRP